MHFTAKKTVKQIIDSGNDYVIVVKANQPKLYNQIQQNIQISQRTSINTTVERVSDRLTERRVSVFDNLDNITPEWVGLKRNCCLVKKDKERSLWLDLSP